MLRIDFEQNFSVFHSNGHIDQLLTAAQIQFCHLTFNVSIGKTEYSAKKAVNSYVQEIKLR